MTRTPNTPTPSPHAGGADPSEFEEHSAVFAKANDETASEKEPTELREADPAPSAVARAARLDAKVREAEALLLTLNPDELHTRLLRIAILRRDEVLLSGVLRTVANRSSSRSGTHAAGSYEPATLLPPARKR